MSPFLPLRAASLFSRYFKQLRAGLLGIALILATNLAGERAPDEHSSPALTAAKPELHSSVSYKNRFLRFHDYLLYGKNTVMAFA